MQRVRAQKSCSGKARRSFPDFGVSKKRKNPQAEENIGKRIRIKKAPPEAGLRCKKTYASMAERSIMETVCSI